MSLEMRMVVSVVDWAADLWPPPTPAPPRSAWRARPPRPRSLPGCSTAPGGPRAWARGGPHVPRRRR